MRRLNTIMLCGAVWATSMGVGFAAPKSRPNVVIIYGDDVGIGDMGAYGAKLIPTPNIDRLASEGLMFNDGHCAAATCTPSRFSMLTGVHGFRHGIRVLAPNAPLCIPTDTLTLPRIFKQAGYHTGVIGKWHLGIGEKGVNVDWNGEVKPGPMELGFDYSFLMPSTNDRVPCVYLDGHRVLNLDPSDPIFVGNKKEVNQPGSTQYPDGKENPEAMTYYKSSVGHNSSVINGIGRIGFMSGGKSALWDDEGMADVFVEKANAYIAAHKDKPFMLYFASQDIHVPHAPHPRFKGKSALVNRGDAMVQFDWTTGEIMKALEKHGLTENTIVIFSSDNGPVYDDGYHDGVVLDPLDRELDRGHDASSFYRGGKYQIYEGGTRIPLIIRWPARIKPGTSSDALVSQIDLMASFAEFFNIKLPKEAARDSRSTMKAFLGEDPIGQEYIIEEAGGLALRRGEWKFIQYPDNKKNATKGRQELYNLKNDIGEKNNIIDDHAEKAESMSIQLQALVDAGRLRK